MTRVKKSFVSITRIKTSFVIAAGLTALYVILVLFSFSGRQLTKALPEQLLVNEVETDTKTSYFFKGLNQHTWEGRCLQSLEKLCNFPIFPKAPDRRGIVDNVDTSSNAKQVTGLRLLGFLRPNVTGEYFFTVETNGFVEVWLSKSISWKGGAKIAHGYPTGKLPKDESLESSNLSVKLSAQHAYYIDIVYARGEIRNNNGPQVKLAWKRPDKNVFEVIPGEFFALFKNDSDMAEMKVYDDDLPDVLACESVRLKFASEHMKPERITYLESSAVRNALNFCDYNPSYLLNPANVAGFRQYQGVYKYVHKTYTLPYSSVYGITRGRGGPAFLAEFPLEEREARSVVDRYTAALEKRYAGKYAFNTIKRVEMKHDPKKGKRYLLELVIKDITDGKHYLLSEYVFVPYGKDASFLCYPNALQWNKTADVYLILTAKNLGRWVHHFIKNVEKIVQETNDDHLHVVIYDFGSPDIDIRKALQRSILKNYHFIINPAPYSRTKSFSEAIKSVDDPDAIVVTIDLHLDIGSQTISDIRKHCFKGKTVYAPQIIFLHCGGSSNMPVGVWYHYSYGTIAMYKRDWESFGGFSKQFLNKDTWGGEDWDVIDGAVKGGLEIERKRAPWIFHYQHNKAGMWQRN